MVWECLGHLFVIQRSSDLRYGGLHGTCCIMEGPLPNDMLHSVTARPLTLLTWDGLEDGPKKKRELKTQGCEPAPLVKKYIDKAGKRRYKGSSALKGSELGP